MEADMWWPALFGDANGRAGGLAQNANIAALLVTILACLTLPALPRDRLDSAAAYAVMLAFAAVLLSQSRMGDIAVLICVASLVYAARMSKMMRWPAPIFAKGLFAALAAPSGCRREQGAGVLFRHPQKSSPRHGNRLYQQIRNGAA